MLAIYLLGALSIACLSFVIYGVLQAPSRPYDPLPDEPDYSGDPDPIVIGVVSPWDNGQ